MHIYHLIFSVFETCSINKILLGVLICGNKDYIIIILIIIVILCSITLLSINGVFNGDNNINSTNITNSTNSTVNATNITNTSTSTHTQTSSNHRSSSSSNSNSYDSDDPLSVRGMPDENYMRDQPTREVNGHRYKLIYDDNGHPSYWYPMN